MKVAYMYGFRKDSEDETGWLRINKSGRYSIVQDRDDATPFPYRNVESVKGWAGPCKWLRFFDSEPELVEWKFHIVKVNKER